MRTLSVECQRVLGRTATVERLSLSPCDIDAIRLRAPGVVHKPETLDYRTFVGERGGLFDGETFGERSATKDGYPYLHVGDDEEIDPAWMRFGRIVLAEPVVHPLFVLHAPEVLAEAANAPLDAISSLVRFELPEERGTAVRMLQSTELGRSLLMTELPVLPAMMRPLILLDGGRFATSDVNDLYRRVISRNNRLARLIELNAPEMIVFNESRMLHEAILALFANESLKAKITDPDERVLVSLSGLGAVPNALEVLDLDKPHVKANARTVAILFALGFEVRAR